MKAGTAQKIALNLLSTTIMLRLGRIYKGLMVNMRVSNRKLQGRAASMVAEMSGVSLGAAEEAMTGAGGDIKLAALLAIGYEEGPAREALAETAGNLRSAIERLGRN
jgi:N-acetylmuramic acid 6-phosphate etherase